MPGIPAALDRDFVSSVTNVTDVRGADVLRRLTMTHFTVYRVEEAGQPFRDGCNNNYSCFNPFRNDIGVYIFQHKDTGDVLYVGQSHTLRTSKNPKGHTLRKRIPQHYTHRNKGGNFRINWCKENCKQKECGDKTQCRDACNPSFMRFTCLIRQSRIIVFSFGQDDNESAKSKIHALESALIVRLSPKYDADTPLINSECVERAIACIPRPNSDPVRRS